MNTSSRPTLRLRATVWRLWLPMLLLTVLLCGLSLAAYYRISAGILKDAQKNLVYLTEEKRADVERRIKTSDATAQLFFTGQSLARSA